MVIVSRFYGSLLDGPGQCGPQGLAQHSPRGFTDGRQSTEGPILRMTLLQLAHEQAVRKHHQVHVPCLALAVAKLTVSHAKLLLAIPMVGLRACPAMPIDPQNPTYLPVYSIGYQNLTRRLVSSLIPNDHNSHLVIYLGNANRTGKVPLTLVSTTEFLAAFQRDRGGKLLRLQFFSLVPYLAIEFQIAHITTRSVELVLLRMDMVQNVCVGEVWLIA